MHYSSVKILLRAVRPNEVRTNAIGKEYQNMLQDMPVASTSLVAVGSDDSAMGSDRGSAGYDSDEADAMIPIEDGGDHDGPDLAIAGASDSDFGSVHGDGDGDSSSVESFGYGSVAQVDTTELILPMSLDGTYFAIHDHTHKINVNRSHLRIRATCKSAKHLPCQKRRGRSSKFCTLYGAWEPVAYLLVWSDACKRYKTSRAHNKHKVTPSELSLAVEKLRANGIEI